jgi:hypothetical protein
MPDRVALPRLEPAIGLASKPSQTAPWLGPVSTLYLPKPSVCEVAPMPDVRR